MKTNEQKLLQLLKIAVENGFDFKEKCGYLINSNLTNEELFKNHKLTSGDNMKVYLGTEYTLVASFNIDYLVCWFEPNEVSFIEALCNADEYAISFIVNKQAIQEKDNSWLMSEYYEQLILLWSWDNELKRIRPTSERLDWLFKTFSHLLT